MNKIKEIYAIENISVFGKNMYAPWKKPPQNIGEDNPFYILSYADDSLSWGDEKQCRGLYEEAFNYYDK